ncbi:hypothetical protein [Arachidicoccus terrestris]|uniref:hypothetical protein n=1 Tax=Arachidicoccus terrestris TaxID=2875539 RepID=UPI001CC5AF06|nr:hypothetical protein [Arachidicoccus terrestris]UAY57159.1 hypothetical protein K9M52_09315 [Arachidicoccus terrestris]
MNIVTKKTLLAIISLLLLSGWVRAQPDQQKGNSEKALLSLSFDELPNTIQVLGNDITYSKFSKTLKISCIGITQYKNANISYTFSLTLPGFDFNNGANNSYSNEKSHFFDANSDAALMLQLGNKQFGNLYRSKEKENILSKVATTDYKINCTNIKDKNGKYIILIRINNGSVLQESSEKKSKTEEETLHISKDPMSQIRVSNPQPALPKVESYKFKSSSEVIYPKDRLN